MSIFFSFLQHETRVLQSTVYERGDHGNDMMVQFVFLPRKFCGKWKMKNKHTTISHHLKDHRNVVKMLEIIILNDNENFFSIS